MGDLVLRLRQDARGHHKLTPPWEGPFIIAEILKPGTYKLANEQGEQRLEHPTAMLFLPLKCFKSFMYLAFFTCINKGLTVKGGSALPQQKPTLPRGLEGGNPLCVKIFLGNIFYQNDFRAFRLYR